MDDFVWNQIPGYPKKTEKIIAEDVIASLKKFEKDWVDFKHTLLFQMRSGDLKHAPGRFFTEKELDFAGKKNAKPIYTIRIQKQYPVELVASKKKKIVPFLKKEIVQLADIVRFVNSQDVNSSLKIDHSKMVFFELTP